MTDTPRPDANGHGDVPAGLKTPAPHPVPSLAAQMAETDAQAQAAAQAELARRAQALHGQIALMLKGDRATGIDPDPAALIMALPDLFGGSLVEMVAAGVQLGLQRAAQAEQQAQEQAAGKPPTHKPILLAQAPLNAMMIREAGGIPGVLGGMG